MSWFNRNKNPYANGTDDYLKSTDTVSRPLAVVFVILIVFVIAAVAFSLFLGGRWLYKNLDGKSTSSTETITIQGDASQTNTSNSGQSTSGSSTPASTPPASSTATATPGSTSATTSATPATSTQAPSALPNTGPEPE
jgi:hypothetical protein